VINDNEQAVESSVEGVPGRGRLLQRHGSPSPDAGRRSRRGPRRSRPATLVTALAALLAAGIVGPTPGAAAQSAVAERWGHDSTTTTRVGQPTEGPNLGAHDLRLHEVFGEDFTFVDVGEEGDSPGDYGVFRDRVTNPAGKDVGTIDVHCVEAYASHCRGSIQITGKGQIVFDGITDLGVDPDEFAITGGTGRYRGAIGALTVSFPNDEFAVLSVDFGSR
jgi:hypothetical protein